jgi:hypothetical protein
MNKKKPADTAPSPLDTRAQGAFGLKTIGSRMVWGSLALLVGWFLPILFPRPGYTYRPLTVMLLAISGMLLFDGVDLWLRRYGNDSRLLRLLRVAVPAALGCLVIVMLLWGSIEVIQSRLSMQEFYPASPN